MFSGKEEAEKLARKYWDIWDRIGYEPNAGNNRSIFGDIFEDVVMEFIKDKVNDKRELGICKGLIKRDDKLSSQIDIIVYSGKPRYVGNVMPIGVVDIKNVKMIIEVKANLHKTNYEIIKKQMKILNDDGFCPPQITTCVFAHWLSMYHGDKPIEEIFDFVKSLVILGKKGRDESDNTYDYGGGLSKFIDILGIL